DEVADYFKKLGAKTVKLKVSAPFHCALMQTAADKFNRELKKYTFTPMNIPVVSNVSATLYCSENQIIENLTNQIVKPVQWQKSMENLSLQGINTIVDIGPKKILKNFSNSILPSVKAYGFDDINDCEALVEWSKKVKRNSTPTYNVLTRCMAVAVCTKNNNWNNDEYREGVITPYQEIKLMQDEIEKEGKLPTDEQCKRGLQLLQTIFDTKKTSYEEQSSRIAQILEETNKELLGTEVMKKYNLN
ncbi:MAG: [acyl-carrier-protein] S-malonyltransferase, partial [Herbinix sp.]|nr:[acyl-carrier-protein] S-malonyltransferase [Herbinix sp.]